MTDGRAAREQDVRGWNCGDKLLLNESFCYSQVASVTGDVFAHLHRTHEQLPRGYTRKQLVQGHLEARWLDVERRQKHHVNK